MNLIYEAAESVVVWMGVVGPLQSQYSQALFQQAIEKLQIIDAKYLQGWLWMPWEDDIMDYHLLSNSYWHRT